MRSQEKIFFILWVSAIIFCLVAGFVSALDYTDYTHRFQLENNGLDSTGRLNLSDYFSPVYSNTLFKEGSYSLNNTDGVGALYNAGAHNLTAGEHDRSFCGWYYTTVSTGTYLGGIGVQGDIGSMLFVSLQNTAPATFDVLAYSNDVSFANVVSENVWEHFCIVYTSGNTSVELYINGSSMGSQTFASPSALSTDQIVVGGSHAGTINSGFFVDDVRFYDFALAPSDVSGLYSSSCTENWTQNLPSSCNGTIQNYTILYTDSNSCGTTINLSITSGTVIDCCVESWSPIYSTCVVDSYLTTYVDSHSCNTTFTLPVDNGTITACIPSSEGRGASGSPTGSGSTLIAVPQEVLPVEVITPTVTAPTKSNILIRLWDNFIAWFKGLFT